MDASMPSQAELVAECDRLKARVAELERRLEERDNPKPPPGYAKMRYPKRSDEA